ncbi:acetoacetate decarboxylase family protein [Millisia brevis]|uniref:acetoacetate decarboxylase family protein n=1 Tax=Millisia brevis TaxID=264148 RepID=UPI00082C2125|nr:acetoacetate decarboxylase family protein [Millisia brevis]
MAPSTIADTVDIELGGRTVSVPKGGLFDRYRMNTDLDRVAADPRVPGVDFFRSLPKTAVESAIGPTLTPNFYYRMSKAQVTMLAPLRAIRTRLPADLEPLRAGPRTGLVSVVFFRYDVCDIDFYTEVAVAIAVRPPGRRRLAPLDTASTVAFDSTHAYVLSLPVNTEIARIRGHDGYGFPKWTTDIDVDIDSRRVTARVANEHGGTDLALSVDTPKQRRSADGATISTLTSYTRPRDSWHETLSQTNVLASGSRLFPRHVDLEQGSGRLTDDLRSVEAGRVLRLDVVTECQNALHLPVPIAVPAR